MRSWDPGVILFCCENRTQVKKKTRVTYHIVLECIYIYIWETSKGTFLGFAQATRNLKDCAQVDDLSLVGQPSDNSSCGFRSWEAMDVQAWKNKQDLERALVSLVEQPGALFAVSDSEVFFFYPAIFDDWNRYIFFFVGWDLRCFVGMIA